MRVCVCVCVCVSLCERVSVCLCERDASLLYYSNSAFPPAVLTSGLK